MKNSSSAQDRGLTKEEYLEHLATEEKRSRILSEIETDPKKRRQARRDNQMFKKLIMYVRHMTGGIETADGRKLMIGSGIETADGSKMDPERPGRKKL